MSTRESPRVQDASASSAEAIEQREEAPTAAIDRHEEEDTGTHDALTEGGRASTASKTSLTDAASSAEPAPDVDSVEASTGGTSGSTIPTRPTPASEAGASSATEKESALVPTTGDEPSPPPPPPPPRRRRPLPPPPRKGILRPPSSSHAATARFSFRRDILQPFNSSYSRAGVAVADHHPGSGSAAPPPPLVSERATAAAAAVGEAVGNAAATAGGFFGNALKRLSAATAVAAGPVAHAATAAPDSEEAASRAVPSAETATSSASASVPTAASTSTTSLASTSSSSSTLVPPSSAPAPPQPPPPPPPPPPAAPTHPLPISSLKQVRFRMASLKVIYPINNGTLDPIAPADEAQTRDRIEEEWRKEMGIRVAVGPDPPLDHSAAAGKERAEKEKGKRKDQNQVEGGGSGGEEVKASRVYTGEELARVYAEACRTREEPGIERLRRFFRDNPKSLPKVLDLSHELLSSGAVAALSDVLAIDWGCKKLVLDACGLDDDALKPLLQSLLVSASIATVSLAGNKRIRNRGWKYLAVFLRKATFLRYLDLSETSIDRKAAEWLVQAIAPQPTPQPPLQHDKQMVGSEDGETKKVPRVRGPWEEEDDSDDDEGPETTASNLNKEDESASTETKGDEEDEPLSAPSPKPPLFDSAPLLKEDWSGDGAAVQSLRLENCGLRGAGLEVLANGLRVSEVKHVSLRKNRINHAGGPYLAIMMRDYPLSTDPASAISSALNSPALSSPTIFRNGFSNGTTAADATTSESPAATEGRNSLTAHRRHLFKPLEEGLHTLVADKAAAATTATEVEHHHRENGEVSNEGRQSPASTGDPETWRMSEARARLRRQIDALPRFGALLTLDVKGNELRHGVTYVAQVLKRNRTLKTLNLSENKIDSHGLTAIAEALKYNSTLETLDMSHNPCCGPGVEGVLALRSALMLSHSLKRIFLNSTELASEGAIALAEFLPESRSVLHLDLTNNHIDISGVLALSVSIKLNSTIRCLDLNIPPNDPDFSRLSQDILNTCVRNTELAQEKADADARRAADGSKRVVVAQPIRKSALASTLEERQRAEERRERRLQETLRSQQDILAAAAETGDVVRELLSVDEAASAKGVIVRPSEVVRDALVQLQLAEAQLAEAAPTTRQGEEREQAEALLSELGSLLDLAKTLYDRPAAPPAAPVERLPVPPPAAAAASADEAPPSPTFSLVDSSDEEDDEDAQAGAVVAPPAANDAAQVHLDSLAIPASDALSERLTVPEQSAAAPSVRSPIESESRAMVAEESEVFRRGLALGVDDVSDEEDDEDRHRTSKNVMVDEGQVLKKSEVSGEELKKEILETPVQRSPRPSFSAEPEVIPPPRPHRRTSSSSSNAVDI